VAEDKLTTQARNILLAAYARSMQRSQVAAWKVFIRFCSFYAHDPWNPSELVFIWFAIFLHPEGYAKSTIFTYLAGIPFFYTILGISISIS
jgi:hypothetical protein